MIDTDKYEGHAEGEWIIQVLDDGLTWNIQTKSGEQLADMVIGKHHGNAKLMRDAPLLLEEVKRLREALLLMADTANGRPLVSGHIGGLQLVHEVFKELIDNE